MAQSGSSFDMSKMSMGSKVLMGSGVLLLIFSFFAWQKVCVADIICASWSMWGGDGSIFGFLGGLALIALLVWEGLQLAGTNVSVGQPASKISAYLGFATAGLVVLRFIFALTESPAFAAFIGLILALGVGYGAWMRFQEPATMPAGPTSEGLA
jgi:hypothetical protein